MNSHTKKSFPHEDLIKLVGQRAENLYENHKLCCSESLLLVLNHGFEGGLTSKQAKQLDAGFCGGMEEVGCTCGALSGASWGLGYLSDLMPKTAQVRKNSGNYPKRCTINSRRNFHPLAVGFWSNHMTRTKRDAHISAPTWPLLPLYLLRNFSSNLTRNWQNIPRKITSPAGIRRFPVF